MHSTFSVWNGAEALGLEDVAYGCYGRRLRWEGGECSGWGCGREGQGSRDGMG